MAQDFSHPLHTIPRWGTLCDRMMGPFGPSFCCLHLLFQEDESLRRWKEKLLGCLEEDLKGQMDPEVRFHSIAVISKITHIMQAILGGPKIRESCNPRKSWMLEVSSASAELQLGINFADYFMKSPNQENKALVKELSKPIEGAEE